MLLDYRLSRKEILTRLEDESNRQVQAVVSDLENWLRGVESTTRLLARILEQREYSKSELQDMLRDVVSNNDEIYGAAIALNPAFTRGTRGFAPYYFQRAGGVHYADLASREANYAKRPWFTRPVAEGRALWSEPYFDTGGGEAYMTTFSVPVYRTNEAGGRYLYGVVTADVTLDALRRALQQLHLGQSSYGLLVSREGILMSARTPASQLRHYSEVAYGQLDMDSWRAMFARALAGETSSGEFPCPEAEGRCTIRMGRLNAAGWPIAVVYNQREVLEPLHRFELKTAAVSTATVLLMGLAVYAVISRLTRPLQQLSAATEHMARGELDVPLPTARGNDEVARLVQSFSSMNRDLKAYIADLERATASRSRLEGELAAAREIQMSMLPGGGQASLLQPRFELWARVQPARSVGGDLYTYYRSDGQLFIAVGDVSDKGVPAALFMARAISLIQQLAGTATPPSEAMAALNDALERDNTNCMFVTLFLGVLDLGSGELHFSSAAHTPPSLLRADTVSALRQESGPALGLLTQQDYPDNCVRLLPGDRVAIFTDGIDEAFNESGEMYGVERFNEQLRTSAGQPLTQAGEQTFQAVAAHAGAQPQSDDITLLLLQYGAVARDRIERDFDLGANLTTRVQAWIQPQLERWGVVQPAAMELNLVAEELVTNVQKYAELSESAELTLAAEYAPEFVALEVRDPGAAFNPLEQAHRSTLGADIESAEIGGLGVHLVTQLTDRQCYFRENGCNLLRVEKDLPGSTG